MDNKHISSFYLIISIALILVLLIGFIRPKPISSVIQKEKFWSDKTHSNQKYNLIFLGDSRLYRGVDAQTVSKELKGLKVLNFGYSSGGQNKLIFTEANKRLDSNASVQAIVLVLSPYSLTPKAQKNYHFKQEAQRSYKEVVQRRFINPVLSFFDPIRPMEIINSKDILPGYHEDFKKHGWVASKKIPSDSEKALSSYVENFNENIVSDHILEELYAQIRRWKLRGVGVFALRIPSTLKMEVLENRLSGYDENKIKTGVEKSGGEWIEIEDKYSYESYDGSHLEESSALRFSKYVGQELRKRLNY